MEHITAREYNMKRYLRYLKYEMLQHMKELGLPGGQLIFWSSGFEFVNRSTQLRSADWDGELAQEQSIHFLLYRH